MSARDERAARIRAQLVETQALADSLKTTLRLLTGEEQVEQEVPAPAPREPRPPRPTAVRKWCPRCKKMVARSRFPPNKAKADGLATYCRPCKRKVNLAHQHQRRDRQGMRPRLDRMAEESRVAARKTARREGRKWGRQPFTRCLFARAKQSTGEMHLVEQGQCGALVFVGDERSHLAEVHGLGEATELEIGKLFAPVVEREDVDDEAVA